MNYFNESELELCASWARYARTHRAAGRAAVEPSVRRLEYTWARVYERKVRVAADRRIRANSLLGISL